MEPPPKYCVEQQPLGTAEPVSAHPGASLPESVANITALADEILLKKIYAHLNPRDVARMACVCRRFCLFTANIWAERGLNTQINHAWFYSYLLRHPVIKKSEDDYRNSLTNHVRNATCGRVTQDSLDGLFKTIDTINAELFSQCSVAEMKMLVDSLTDQAYQAAMGRLSVVLQNLHSPTSEDRAASALLNLPKPADDTLSQRRQLSAILITCPLLSETRKILSHKLDPTDLMAILDLNPYPDEEAKSDQEVDEQIIERLSEALNLSDLQVLVRINASSNFQAMQIKLMEQHKAMDLFIRVSAVSLISDAVLSPATPDE